MNSLVRYFFLLSLFFTWSVNAQMYQRKNMPLVDFNGSFKMKHFYFSPGLTYMLPNEISKLGGNNLDNINANGRIGFIIEAGMYHIFEGGGNVFNYMDYGLSYKKLSGSEINRSNKSIFKQRYLSLNYNINNIKQLTSRRFIQSSIGANLDYKLFENNKDLITPENTKRLLFSFHLKLGYGMKFQNRLFVIPTIETPIINIKEWEKGKSTYGIFNSRYRPILIKIRILWLKRSSGLDCLTPKLNPEDQNRYQNNYMQ